jgi:glucoamylase
MRLATLLVVSLAYPARLLAAADAPGAPGERPTWTNANKQGVGTSASAGSRVWFTLGQGALNEIYYPTVDTANTRLVELVVTDGLGLFERETLGAEHRVEIPDPHALVFRQVNTSRSGSFRIEKTTFTDPLRDVVLVRVRFVPQTERPLRLFLLADPALRNSGMGDAAWAEGGALLASESGVAMALVASTGFGATTSGYLGTSDGLAELRRGAPLPHHERASSGNVAQLAEIRLPERGEASFTLAIGFGPTPDEALRQARASLATPVGDIQEAYARGWREYLAGLRMSKPPHADLYAMAAMQLKAHEDKTHSGAMIASLTKPWGDDVDASGGDGGGYHLVWSRDLYHVATAFLALGDRAAAERALDYLFRVQQREDGSFPQNSWLDGRPFWPSVQLDEVAYPLVLALELGRADAETWRRHARPAAEYILRHGPRTPQERWEEEEGYSPASIAAQIAGLVAAAELARRNGDADAAGRYQAAAREWAALVKEWTVTRTGPHSSRPYFLRITAEGRPDSGAPLELNNGAGTHDERAVVDAGFLELVRFGILPPDDPEVVESLRVIDRVLRVETPNGPTFYRYNHDGYGEKPDGRGWDGVGVGRLWAFLAGERGEYELAAGRDARAWLDALAGFANEGRLLPEQVWDRAESPRPHLVFGEGTGSATPLAWTCAQFIRLVRAVEDGKLLGTPETVRRFFRDSALPHAEHGLPSR